MTSSVLDFFKNLVGGSDNETEDLPVANDVGALNEAVAKATLQGDSKESSDKETNEDIKEEKSNQESAESMLLNAVAGKKRWVPKMRSLSGASIDLRPQTKSRSSSTEKPAMPAQSASRSGDAVIEPKDAQEGPRKAKYMPPGARSRGASNASQRNSMTSSMTSSGDQERFRKWCNWDNSELDKRKRALIGKTVVGKLSPKRGNRYFIKWNINANDTVVIAADKVEEILGETPMPGMWVSCTIVGLGPSHVQWNKQHPYAMALESRETRASHQPSKGKMPRNSPHWKKSQKAGLTRQVTSPIDQRQTVPAEIDMSRYAPNSARAPRDSRTAPTARDSRLTQTMPSLPSGAVIARSQTGVAHVVRAKPVVPTLDKPIPPFNAENLAKAANNGSVNLVTGEVKPRGRADSAASWRKRDRSYTV